MNMKKKFLKVKIKINCAKEKKGQVLLGKKGRGMTKTIF